MTRKSYTNLNFSKVKLMKPKDISTVVLFIASEDAKAMIKKTESFNEFRAYPRHLKSL